MVVESVVVVESEVVVVVVGWVVVVVVGWVVVVVVGTLQHKLSYFLRHGVMDANVVVKLVV